MYWSKRAIAFSKVPEFVKTQIEQRLLPKTAVLFKHHISSLFNSNFQQEYEAGLSRFQQRMDNWVHDYQTTVKSLGEQFKCQMREHQEESKQKLTEYMDSMFRPASLIRGTMHDYSALNNWITDVVRIGNGKYISQKHLIEDWGIQHGEEIFVILNAWIRDRVETSCTELEEQIVAASREAAQKLYELEVQTAKEICSLLGPEAK